jgi:hypothetical protein
VAQGVSGQTANLQEWQNSAGTALTVVDKDGNVGIGTASPKFKFHVVGTVDLTALLFDSIGVVASNIIGRRANGTPSALAPVNANDNLLVLTSRGYAGPGLGPLGDGYVGDRAIIRLGASENWSATGQGAYISFDTAASGTTNFSERMRIAHDGNVGVGTTNPQERLHVAGNVRAAQFITGDIVFENGVRATEEGEGLAFLNAKGNKVAVLDADGNLHIKGDIIKDL